MPRDHKKRKKSKSSPATPVEGRSTIALSPTAQAINQKIATGGTHYLMENMSRIMIDSYDLANEQEFTDFSFDGEKVIKVTERLAKKYESRLSAAKMKGEDAFSETFDDIRIEIIEELATPTIRNEILRRLQELLDRLMLGQDHKKLEMVLLLTTILGMKKIPWGICGLVLAIYERSMKQEMALFEQQEDIYDAVVKALDENEEGPAELSDLIKSPKKLKLVVDKILKTKPQVLETAEKQAWKFIEGFEKQLLEGKVHLDLFTEEELAQPIRRIEAELGMPASEIPQSEMMNKRTFDIFVETINQILTNQERYQRLRSDLQSTLKTWERQNNRWAPILRAELDFLEEEYEQNKFVLAAFFGQMARAGKS